MTVRENQIYVIGHVNPDTDSIASAIGYAWLLRERDGASAIEAGNLTSAQASWFVNAPTGDLPLVSTSTAAIDQAVPLGSVIDDYDAEFRPSGAGPDIGAD